MLHFLEAGFAVETILSRQNNKWRSNKNLLPNAKLHDIYLQLGYRLKQIVFSWIFNLDLGWQWKLVYFVDKKMHRTDFTLIIHILTNTVLIWRKIKKLAKMLPRQTFWQLRLWPDQVWKKKEEEKKIGQ